MGQTLLGGSTTTSTPIVGSNAQNLFMNGLFGLGDTGGTLQGENPYPGSLSPDPNSTILPAVNSDWSLNNNGTNYLAGMLGGDQYNPDQGNIASSVNAMNQYGGVGGSATTNQNNMAAYGTVGGAPGQMISNMAQYGGTGAPATTMSNMMQYGGTGGPGSNAMGNLMQYGGVGGQGANNPMSNIAQTGTNGSWGNALNTQAAGGAGPINNFATTGGLQGLQGIINGQGNPVNQTPAWNAMVAAEQQPIQEGATNLAEQFNGSDNRFSSVFGTAATDYQTQAQLGLTSQLTAATTQAQQAAQGNLLSASSTLGGLGTQAAGQQSSQMYGAAGQLANLGYGGAQSVYGAQNTAAQSIYGTQNTAATNMYNTANTAAMGMYNTQNTAATNSYNAQNQYNMANMGYSTNMLGLGQNAASSYNNALNTNLQTGSTLGQQNYNNQQSAINNQYTAYQQTLPQNNPLLQYMYGAATGYTQNSNSSSGLLGALGGLLGGTGSLLRGLNSGSGNGGGGGSGGGSGLGLGNDPFGGTSGGSSSTGIGSVGDGGDGGQAPNPNPGGTPLGGGSDSYGSMYGAAPSNMLAMANNPYMNTNPNLMQGSGMNQNMLMGSGYNPYMMMGSGGASPYMLSDRRLKEDIRLAGKVGPLDLYSYRFKGLPGRKIGPMAQDVYKFYPEAVEVGNDTEPWMIKPGILLEALARSY